MAERSASFATASVGWPAGKSPRIAVRKNSTLGWLVSKCGFIVPDGAPKIAKLPYKWLTYGIW